MEVPLPERVAHDGDRAILSTASLIVRGRERAAENRRDTEDIEEAAAGQNPVDVFGLATVGEVVSLAAERERTVKELRIAPPELFPERVRPRRPPGTSRSCTSCWGSLIGSARSIAC